jgi:hypothetical protein
MMRTAATLIIVFLSLGLEMHAQTVQRDSQPATKSSLEQTKQTAQEDMIEFPSLGERSGLLAILVLGAGGLWVLVDQLRRRADKVQQRINK